MTAYYNEHDPYAAAWLRNLIAAGHIAPGTVDESDIRDINPDDLRGYTQCHFFAGIGIWSHALRRAGWSDERPIWTGSCPCQPFSAAGRGAGIADERHLWPHWFHLISECRPGVIVGEQVASKDGLGWNDLVSADLEGTGYAFGAFDLCAAGFGGAHIRQRQYFVGMADADGGDAGTEWQQRRREHRFQQADDIAGFWMADNNNNKRLEGQSWDGIDRGKPRRVDTRTGGSIIDGCDASSGMADTGCPMLQLGQQPGNDTSPSRQAEREAQQLEWCGSGDRDSGAIEWLANSTPGGWREERQNDRGCSVGDRAQGLAAGHGSSSSDIGLADDDDERRERLWGARNRGTGSQNDSTAGGAHAPMLGRNAVDWIFCRDGKWRPVESGTFPLDHEDSRRVGPGGTVETQPRIGKLKAYGNALDAETAFNFVETVKDIIDYGVDLSIADEDLIG